MRKDSLPADALAEYFGSDTYLRELQRQRAQDAMRARLAASPRTRLARQLASVELLAYWADASYGHAADITARTDAR